MGCCLMPALAFRMSTLALEMLGRGLLLPKKTWCAVALLQPLLNAISDDFEGSWSGQGPRSKKGAHETSGLKLRQARRAPAGALAVREFLDEEYRPRMHSSTHGVLPMYGQSCCAPAGRGPDPRAACVASTTHAEEHRAGAHLAQQLRMEFVIPPIGEGDAFALTGARA